MRIDITPRKYKLDEKLKARITDKLQGLSKFFKEEVRAKVNIYEEHKKTKIEATLSAGSLIIRTENAHVDAVAAVDNMDDLLKRRILKNKTRLRKNINESVKNIPVADEVIDEVNYDIVKKKKFDLKPMSQKEAILQMNLLGHDFFVYINGKTGNTEVVYRRKDGNYACIQS